MPDRLYCTLAELLGDLELDGTDQPARVVERIRAASDWIDGALGKFIPVTAAKRLDGPGGTRLFLPEPLLSVTSIVDDAITLTASDYLLYPRSALWENGPYIRIEIAPDAPSLSAWTRERDIVVVTGKWGKYSATESTGATVDGNTDANTNTTSLAVDNGGLISPGMVLLVDSEQVLVTAAGAKTDTNTNTAEALDASETGVDVVDGTKVNAGEIVRVDAEDLYVSAVDGNTLAVLRGYNGTDIVTHTTAADVYAYRTYTVKRGVNGTTAAAHADNAAISRYAAPWDVNWLCRQVAGLMHKKAKSGFVGKSGNVELGQVFYLDEFPKKQVEDIRARYRITTL